jgi:hypothetical protein
VEAIQEGSPSGKVFAPVFEEFDWRTSIQGFRSGLPDGKDWRFRFWITLLFAELLLERYAAGGEF